MAQPLRTSDPLGSRREFSARFYFAQRFLRSCNASAGGMGAVHSAEARDRALQIR
jgi:hypothetical protein